MTDRISKSVAYDELSDHSLIARSIEGDRRAFEKLVDRHSGWLYRFVRRNVWNNEDAFDVLQESLVGAWLSLSRYDPEQPFNIWLRSIALNKCRDRARRTKVWRALFGSALAPPLFENASDPALTPELSMEFRQAADLLHNAIAALPRTLREPLVLTLLEGLSQKESADLLKISVKAVETRVYRAKIRLAQGLDHAQLQILQGKDRE